MVQAHLIKALHHVSKGRQILCWMLSLGSLACRVLGACHGTGLSIRQAIPHGLHAPSGFSCD